MREGYNSLEKRGLRGDMTEMYKIMHGVENVDRVAFFSLSHNIKTQIGSSHKADGWEIQHSAAEERPVWFFGVLGRTPQS